MSLGFKQLSIQDEAKLIKSLKKITDVQFERNQRKLFDYVGGEAKAKRFAKMLHTEINVLSLKSIRETKRSDA